MKKVKLNSTIVNKDYKEELSSYDRYIAVDWSKNTMAIARLTSHALKPKVIEVASDIKEMKLYLKRLTGKKILTIEETTTSQWLYVELLDYVDRIVICDPYRNRLLSDGPKNDKIDAKKLSILLKGGMIKEIYHTTDKIYKLRKYVSAYDDLIKYGVRLLNQKSAIYLSEGLSNRKAVIPKEPITKFILERLEKAIEVYEENKQQYKELFKKISKKNKLISNQITLPGIGEAFAVRIVSTVVDARRFKRAGHYLVYCGLVKHEKFSGGKCYGKRKPRCNRSMKAVYKMAALAAIRSNSPMKQYYEYLVKKGLPEHNARNAVARYIAKLSYGMMKNQEKHQPYKWRKTDLA
ncbi:MAG: transposase [Ignavibacteria bacterium]|jgi:hypothetical protein